MSDYSYDYSVLIVAEPDFGPASKDPHEYLSKLNNFLTKRAVDSNLRVVTVGGRYGVPAENVLDIDDKNKTAFVKSLDDHLNQFNEVVIIANFEKDPFLDALGIRLAELSKSFTIYGYETEGNEKP
jgi:restriction endonuclease